jgi:hypothetical protein
MMTDTRDPVLLELFDNARQEFEGQDMTAKVMVKTRKRLATMAAVAATAGLLVLLISWYLFSMPLLEFAVLISQFLTNPLFDLGEGWITLIVLPINNFASIAVLLTKVLLMGWKKLTGTTLVR